MELLTADISPDATHAGGLEEIELEHIHHDKVPHVYVVYWPEHGVLKVGKSRQRRWKKWQTRGGFEIATINVCCDEHSGTVEQVILRELAGSVYVTRAFTAADQAAPLLGDSIGWTECYRMPSTKRRLPTSPYDYDNAYGLWIPLGVLELLEHYDAVWEPLHMFSFLADAPDALPWDEPGGRCSHPHMASA